MFSMKEILVFAVGMVLATAAHPDGDVLLSQELRSAA
jgi:hypothetical protein